MLDTGQKVNNTTSASDLTFSKITSRKGQKITIKNEIAETSKKIIEPRKSWSSQIIRPRKKTQDQNLIV